MIPQDIFHRLAKGRTLSCFSQMLHVIVYIRLKMATLNRNVGKCSPTWSIWVIANINTSCLFEPKNWFKCFFSGCPAFSKKDEIRASEVFDQEYGSRKRITLWMCFLFKILQDHQSPKHQVVNIISWVSNYKPTNSIQSFHAELHRHLRLQSLQPTSRGAPEAPKTSRGSIFWRRKLRWWSTLWCHGFACFLPREWNKSFVNPSTRLDANHLAMGKLEGRKCVGPLPSHHMSEGKYSHHASPTWIENLVENWHVLLQPLLVFGKSGMLWLHGRLPK